MNNRTKFYCWIIAKLQHEKLTIDEICDGWERASANTDVSNISTRTFHRYREEIRSKFGVSIECDASNGYRYYIERNPSRDSDLNEWMLGALRIASLSDMLKHSERAIVEPAPGNSQYLEDVMAAIDANYALHFDYVTPYGERKEITLVPSFIRLFHQRWYVIGVKAGTDDVRILAFDRMSNVETVNKRHKLSAKMTRLLDPATFFSDCFSITRMEDVEPQTIRLRAFFPEYRFLDEVPLHHSQEKVAESEGGEYCEYMLRLRPSFDFKQELLWHGRKIVVLEPETLRQDMIKILKDMTESYSTGKDMLKE